MAFFVRVNNFLVKGAGFVAMVTLGAVSVVVPYEAFCRYVLTKMNIWTTEFSIYAIVWATMMGAAAGLPKRLHVGITTLHDKLPPLPAKILQAFIYILVLVFVCIMGYNSVLTVAFNYPQTSSTMGISMSIPYLAMPLGFFIMAMTTIQQLLELFGFSAERSN
jgi:TRAP-type C4-dicarboxylate transport system permease small subunit